MSSYLRYKIPTFHRYRDESLEMFITMCEYSYEENLKLCIPCHHEDRDKALCAYGYFAGNAKKFVDRLPRDERLS